MNRDLRQERDLIRKSVRWTWERESAIRFTGWRKCKPGDQAVRLSFEGRYPRTAGRGSELAGVPAGVKLPTLWSLAALSINMKAPVHEFGHVLGFGHEYARRDVADPARCGADLNGVPYIEDDEALTPYDEHSIMVGCRPGATARFSSGVPSLSAGDIFGLVQTYGSHPDNVLDADEAGDLFGAAVLAGDMDSDGVADLAVGAPGEDEGQGAVYLYRGDADKGFRPWRKITAPEGGRSFGASLPGLKAVAAEGGRTDLVLLIGDQQGPNRPHSYLLSNPAKPVGRLDDGGVYQPRDYEPALGPHVLRRFADDLRAGPPQAWQVTWIDLDDDGVRDVIAGMPSAMIDGRQTGAVIVFRGVTDVSLAEWYWFGQSY